MFPAREAGLCRIKFRSWAPEGEHTGPVAEGAGSGTSLPAWYVTAAVKLERTTCLFSDCARDCLTVNDGVVFSLSTGCGPCDHVPFSEI